MHSLNRKTVEWKLVVGTFISFHLASYVAKEKENILECFYINQLHIY